MTKIAIIEDDRMINQMYRMKFEGEGFEVAVAENGKDGLALIKDWQPDAILLDLWMPEMDGLTALKTLRQNPATANLPVVILTNSAGPDAAPELRNLGIADYIIKADLTPREVVVRVKKVLGLDQPAA